MKLEDIATPPTRPSPQVRYASLNRTIEGGLATDQTWSELTRVCLELGRDEEACAAFQHVRDVPTRRRLIVYLHRRGLMLHVDPASFAGPASTGATPPEENISEDKVTDLILDSVRYLFVDHMPLAVIVATVIFPIVVGLGGALSAAAGSTLFLPLIAMIPALSIVGLVGALGRRILLESAKGLDDPPEIPTVQELAREAMFFMRDFGALAGVFLAPGFLLALIGAGAAPAISALMFGGLLFPMAMSMRQVRGDWSALDPKELCTNVVAGGTRYLGCAAFAVGVFTPALLSVWLTFGSHVYLTLSVVGPLAVAPLFMVSRIMGQLLFLEQRDARRAPRPVTKPKERRPSAAARPAPLYDRPAARPAPPQGRPAARPAPTRTPLRTAQQHPESKPSVRRPAWPGVGPGAPAKQARAKASATAPVTRKPGESFFGHATPAQTPPTTSLPELAHMPGARVLRGEARHRAGASAPIRPE